MAANNYYKRKMIHIVFLLALAMTAAGCTVRGGGTQEIETAEDVMLAAEIPDDARFIGAVAKRKTYTVGETELIPGGEIFGVKFFTKGVIVVDTSAVESENGKDDPARRAGLNKNDIILSIDGCDVNSVEEIADAVARSGGKPLSVVYKRGRTEARCELTPVKSVTDGTYKTGLWIRDSTAGIGTITFIDKKDGYFAGLGHGICDADTGTLMPLRLGAVVDVTLTDIMRGSAGCPGELKGSFGTDAVGYLVDNTVCGVSGYLAGDRSEKQALPVAAREDVKEGDAVILSAIGGDGVKAYRVRLTNIDTHAHGTKCFGIEVTDENLIALSGGIVQGMSGSPIIQNGHIAGAVTHVLISDPTKGYGIFAENMLSFEEKAAA